jgi:ribosomal protein L40E
MGIQTTAPLIWSVLTILSFVTTGVIACCGSTQQQQQQQRVVVNDDEPQRVCPECGIENPVEATYCGDCGFAFKNEANNDSG